MKRAAPFVTFSTDYSTPDKILKFLKLKIERDFLLKLGSVSKPRKMPRGISKDKKENILKHLCPLMPRERQGFWLNLQTNENANDLNESFD